MEIAKLIVDLIGKLIWPMVVLIIVWKFRKQIAIRFKDISEIELPGGIKAKMNQVIQATVEEVVADNSRTELDKENAKENIDDEDQFDDRDSSGSNILLAFTANKTRNENLKYNIYYDPVDRNHNLHFKFIGLYAWKSIIAVGRVNKIVSCNYDNGVLTPTKGYDLSILTDDEYNRIKEVIEATDYYNIKTGVKFFLVDKFYRTNFIKSTNYPIRAKKYIWLDSMEGFNDNMTAEQLATFLNGKKWR